MSHSIVGPTNLWKGQGWKIIHSNCWWTNRLDDHCELFIPFFFFREERIRNGSKKLAKSRTTAQQGRLDSFFSITRTVTTTTPKKKSVVNILESNHYEIIHFLLTYYEISPRKRQWLLVKASNEKLKQQTKRKQKLEPKLDQRKSLIDM